jgi:hypothetical protein
LAKTYQNNADAVKLKVKSWVERNPDRVAKTKAKYRDSNRELLREKNRLRHAEKPHLAVMNQSLRKARQLQATPPWADICAIERVYELAQVTSELSGVKFSVDHIVPLKHKLVCGLHVPANLRVITLVANKVKANKFEIT